MFQYPMNNISFCLAVTDTLCINFADERVAAYPNVKIVLTTRDPDSWVESMGKLFYEISARGYGR